MKTVADTRKPYSGLTRSLVIAIDVGTTFSGVSYAILEPGEIPKIHGVTRFPGQEHVAGNSKIPSILYYDKRGELKAAGAEADNSSIQAQAEDDGWIKVELFKLRLRPRTMHLSMNGLRLAPLPSRKSPVHIFGDFLSYLYTCTTSFIKDTHANGSALLAAIIPDHLEFVLAHPNGWEGAQQAKMRRAAVYGGLVGDTPEGRARIRFVTEGEASLHACVLSGLAADVLSNPSKHGFLIADAGGGTLDISSYAIKSTHPLVMEEIAPPDCIFAGSVFVSRRAREFFEHKLKGSQYGTPDSLDHITKRFDETTKRLFRDRHAPQFVPFGSPFDKDSNYGIRAGQLKLTGAEVANVFEPSVDAAYTAIRKQIEACHGMIKSVFLVGGYAASPWLFTQLQERLAVHKIIVSRPDTQTSKAVADGAVGFYCDHHVSARMSRFMYGVEYLRQVDPSDPDHVARLEVRKLCELPSGPKLLPDAFDCILARGVKVKEATVFTRKYCTELTSLSMLRVFEVEVWCYRGGDTIPKWIDRMAEDFSTLCVVKADLSMLSDSAEPKTGRNGKTYWTIVFSVEIHFGLTEFRARIKWVQDGATKYGPATIVYNERGHRSDEDEPDFYPEDDAITGSGNAGSSSSSRAGDRKSHHASSRPQTPVNGHPVDSTRRTRDGSGPAAPSIRGSISNSGASLRASSSNAPSVKPAGSPSVMASAALRASGGSNPPTPNRSAHVPLRKSDSKDKERERERDRSRPSTPPAGSRSGRSSVVHPAGSPAAGPYSSRSRPRSPVVDPPIPLSPLSRSQSQAQSVLHSHRTPPAKLGEATDLWGGGGGAVPPQSIFGEDPKSAFGVSDDILGGERPKSLFDTDGDEGGGEPRLGGAASSIFGEPATAIHDGMGLGGAGLWGTPTDGPPPPVADGWNSWGRGEGQTLDTPIPASATLVPATPVVASAAAAAAASVVASTPVEEAPPISPAVSKSGKKKKGATPKASPAVSRANSGQDAGVKVLSPLNPAVQAGVATPAEAPAEKEGGDNVGERGAGVTPIEIPVAAGVVQEDVGTPATPAGEGVGASPVTPGGGKKKKKKGGAAALAEKEEADRKVKEERKAEEEAEEAERKAKVEEAERKAEEEEERRGKAEEEKKARELKEEEERKEKERLEQERLEKEKAELEEKERERQRQEMDTKAKAKFDRDEKKRKEKEEKERKKKEEERLERQETERKKKEKEEERKKKLEEAERKKKEEEQEREKKEEQERVRKEEEEKVRKAAEEEAARLKKAKEEAAARLKEEEGEKRRAEEDARLQAEKEEHEKTVRKLQEEENRMRRELEELELQEKREREREEQDRKEKEEQERKARESNSGGFGFGFASKSLFGNPTSLFGSASPTEERQEESTGIGGWGFGSLTKKKSITPSEPSAKRPSPFAKAGWGMGAATQPPGAFGAIDENPQLGNPSSLFGNVDVNNVFDNFDNIGLKDVSKPAGGMFEGASVFGDAGADGATGGGAIFGDAGAGGGIFDGSGALGSELGGAGAGGGIFGGVESKVASRPPSPPAKSEVGAGQSQTPLLATPVAERAGEDEDGWGAAMVKGKKKKGGKNAASNNVSQQPTRAPSPDPVSAGGNLLSPTDDAGGNAGEDDAWGAVGKKGKKGKKGKAGAGGVDSPATGAQTPQVQAEPRAGGAGAGENLANDLADLLDDGHEAQEEDAWSQPAGKKKGKKGAKNEDPPETPAVEKADNVEGGGDEKNEALEGAEGGGEEGGEKKDADDEWAIPVKTKKKKGKKGAAEDDAGAAAAGGESAKPADDDWSTPATAKKKKKKK